MPKLTTMDEYFVHQIPEPLPNVVSPHAHWRESYFFVTHPRSGNDGDVVILAMAHYPARGVMDALLMGRIGGKPVFGRHERPYDGDPHTTAVGPAKVEIVEPYKTMKLTVDDATGYSMDLEFEARTQAYGLRRGRLMDGAEIIWDQSHMVQSGVFNGTYAWQGQTYEVSDWWGQRDHSWGIRDHRRCPMWMWLAIQLPDGMFGGWNWEMPNGQRVFMDCCFAPADGSDPVAVVDFEHDISWTKDGEPVDYGDGSGVTGMRGRVVYTLETGRRVAVEGEGSWGVRYGPLGGGQCLMTVRTDDGREGNGMYEITGCDHHRYFPGARE